MSYLHDTTPYWLEIKLKSTCNYLLEFRDAILEDIIPMDCDDVVDFKVFDIVTNKGIEKIENVSIGEYFRGAFCGSVLTWGAYTVYEGYADNYYPDRFMTLYDYQELASKDNRIICGDSVVVLLSEPIEPIKIERYEKILTSEQYVLNYSSKEYFSNDSIRGYNECYIILDKYLLFNAFDFLDCWEDWKDDYYNVELENCNSVLEVYNFLRINSVSGNNADKLRDYIFAYIYYNYIVKKFPKYIDKDIIILPIKYYIRLLWLYTYLVLNMRDDIKRVSIADYHILWGYFYSSVWRKKYKDMKNIVTLGTCLKSFALDVLKNDIIDIVIPEYDSEDIRYVLEVFSVKISDIIQDDIVEIEKDIKKQFILSNIMRG